MAEQSLTITFVTTTQQAIEDASVNVELDDTYNNDATQFLYGEKAYYKIYTYPHTATIAQTLSDGTLTSENSGYETVTEIITFANTNEANLSYPLYSLTSFSWFGDGLGSISYTGKKITASQSGVGVLKITYRTYFRRYAISVPVQSEDEYTILNYITTS